MWTDCIIITIKQPLYRFTFQYSSFHNFLTVFRLYVNILIIIWFNSHQRSKFT